MHILNHEASTFKGEYEKEKKTLKSWPAKKIIQNGHLINKDSFLHLCGILDAFLHHIACKLVLGQVEHFAAHAVHCKILNFHFKI